MGVVSPVVFLLVALGLCAMLGASVRRQSLTPLGALVAAAMGLSLMAIGGFVFLVPLLAFYLSSTALSKYKKARKETIERRLHARTGRRDWVQVIANGGPGVLVALLSLRWREPAVVVAYYTVFAACAADTWASEIGVLSPGTPVSLIRRAPIEKGLSGGVSALGTLFAVLGGSFIALVYLMMCAGVPGVASHALVIAACGLLGSVIDSVLGEFVQARYRSRSRGTPTEKPMEDGLPNELIGGVAWIDNDVVNFLSPSLAAAVAALLVR